jgi:hypothetical protein
VSPMRYELRYYIPKDGILHSYRHENLKSYFLFLVFRKHGDRGSPGNCQFLAFPSIVGALSVSLVSACGIFKLIIIIIIIY